MITKRGNVWWLDIWVGHGKTRKRVRRSLKTNERALALERARDVERELERGPAKKGLLLSEFVPRYLEWAKQTIPASYRTDKGRAEHIVSWMAEKDAHAMEDITPYIVEQFRADVCRHDRRQKDPSKTAKRSTANRYCALLRSMFNRAKDWGAFEGPNPLSKVKFYRESDKARPLTDEDVVAIMNAAREIAKTPESPAQARMPDILELYLNTGLRRAELLRLRWQDYHDSLINVLGKGERRRDVPLNAAAEAVIRRQPKTSAYIFDLPNRHQPDMFRRTVARIRKLSSVSHFHLHLCRHYAATKMLMAGIDIQTVAEILGQTRLSTTLLYVHSTPERRRDAVRAIQVGTHN